MINWLDNKYLMMKGRMKRFADEFLKGEMGVAPFVATILLILIVVLLCAIFWKNISTWFEEIWGSITKSADKIKISE